MDTQALDRHITGNWGEDSVDDDQTPPREDVGEILEFLLNRHFITDDDAKHLAELSLEEIQGIYDNHVFPKDEDEPFDVEYDRDLDKGYEENLDQSPFDYDVEDSGWIASDFEGAEDDDPQCVCGVYRSEHSALGCPEGFKTPGEWNKEREFIRSLDDDEYDRIYHPDDGYYD